jgi:predicted MFS family arabinose efflux permease
VVTSTIGDESRSEWAASWRIPLISAIAIAVSVVPLYSLGALMPAIQAGTGWTRSQIASGPTFLSVVAVLCAPFVGIAIDRFGSRRIGLPGLVIFCLAVASLSLVGPSIITWWLAWTFVAIGYLFVKVTVWTAAVVTRFDRGRGLAIGVALSGTGLGSSSLPYVATLLQDGYGWRATYVCMALGGALLSLPIAWLYFYDAGDERRRTSPAAVDRSMLPGSAPREAFRSRRYLQMALGTFLSAVASIGLVVHFVPIVREGGLSAYTAAATAAGIGVSTVVGRLAAGFLLDRFSGPLVGFVSCALPIASCGTLLVDRSAGSATAAAVLIGLSAGAEIDVITYLVPRYFGVRHFGLLFGVLNSLLTLGLGVGPFTAGYLFDRFGNYDNVLLLAIPVFAASAVLFGTLGRPVRDATTATATAAAV